MVRETVRFITYAPSRSMPSGFNLDVVSCQRDYQRGNSQTCFYVFVKVLCCLFPFFPVQDSFPDHNLIMILRIVLTLLPASRKISTRNSAVFSVFSRLLA